MAIAGAASLPELEVLMMNDLPSLTLLSYKCKGLTTVEICDCRNITEAGIVLLVSSCFQLTLLDIGRMLLKESTKIPKRCRLLRTERSERE